MLRKFFFIALLQANLFAQASFQQSFTLTNLPSRGCLNDITIIYDSDENSLEFVRMISSVDYVSFADYRFTEINQGRSRSFYMTPIGQIPAWSTSTWQENGRMITFESTEKRRIGVTSGKTLRTFEMIIDQESMITVENRHGEELACHYSMNDN